MSQRSPEWLVPDESTASPAEHRPRDPRDVRWYLPTWGERLRLLGWRNVLWLPPLCVVAFAAFELSRGMLPWRLLIWWKVIVVAVAWPMGAVVRASATALKDRRDPFCIHCGYSQVGLADGTPCPECGEVTSHALCREYQHDPQWFIERYAKQHATPAADVPFEVRRDAPMRGDGT